MAAAAEQMDAQSMMERPRRPSIPAGTMTAADIAASSMTQMQVQHPPAPVTAMDPGLVQMAKTAEALAKLAEPAMGALKKPGGKGPVAAGIVSGLLGAFLAVWVHDISTRNSVSPRLDKQDEAIEKLADVVEQQSKTITAQGVTIATLRDVLEGLADEGEADIDFTESAFVALSKGQPIPARDASGRKRLRRTLSRQ